MSRTRVGAAAGATLVIAASAQAAAPVAREQLSSAQGPRQVSFGVDRGRIVIFTAVDPCIGRPDRANVQMHGRVRVARSGRFSYDGAARLQRFDPRTGRLVGSRRVTLRFAGRFITPTTARGFSRIAVRGCRTLTFRAHSVGQA